jgi:DNA-binding NarL/FixJ family response regulator
MQKIRTLIIDDHRIVIDGLSRVLELDGRVDVVATAASLAEAEVLSESAQPDVVLVDLRLPDSIGCSAVERAKTLFPDARIVVITGYGEKAKAEARKLGADAFVTKELASEEIAQTICDFFPSGVEGWPREDRLSSREADVARLVAEGLTNAEVARALCVSSNTVKTHLASVLRKTGVRDRVALALHWKRLRRE